jgi:inner membrane protein
LDSLTQLTLGAALGETFLGKKIGNKGILIGAFIGTLSDLDVIPGQLLDTPDRLLFHRGFTHSLAFVLIATLLLSQLFKRWCCRKQNIPIGQWHLFFAVTLAAGILIDAFTTYGTQLLWPYKYRFEFNTLFVVDPLFTLPLLITTIWLMFKRKDAGIRHTLNRTGIFISAAYLLFTIANKQVIDSIFRQSLKEQNITYSRFISNPMPMNQILWTSVAETENHYLTGYYGHLDKNKDIAFEASVKNHHLIEPYLHMPPVSKIIRFTKGYYTVEKVPEGFLINDLRFGSIKNWSTGEKQYVFQYLVSVKNGVAKVTENRPGFDNTAVVLKQLWQRIKGNKEFE